MKKLIGCIIIILISTQAYAVMSGITKGGDRIACRSKSWLEDIRSFGEANDRESFNVYLESKKCIILKEGVRVTVTDPAPLFGLTVGYVYKGIKWWSGMEVLNYVE